MAVDDYHAYVEPRRIPRPRVTPLGPNTTALIEALGNLAEKIARNYQPRTIRADFREILKHASRFGKLDAESIAVQLMAITLGLSDDEEVRSAIEHIEQNAQDLNINPETKEVSWKGEWVDLGLPGREIVSLLHQRNGAEVTWLEIYEAIYPGKDPATSNAEKERRNVVVRNFMSRIRAKFREIDTGFNRIANTRGCGYRWEK